MPARESATSPVDAAVNVADALGASPPPTSADTSAPTSADVVVVGAGAVGLAIAWRLAGRGRDTVIIDPDPGGGASWAAAGMLAPVTEVHYGEQDLLALNLASSSRWPDFAHELEASSGIDPGYRESGTLVVARDRDEREALDELERFQRSLDLAVERLGAQRARELEPGLDPRIHGGLLANDHQVDNRALVHALAAANRRAGTRAVIARVAGVLTGPDGVTGVRLAGGSEVSAATVVVAAGAWSARLEGVPDGLIPVRPVKGELLHLRAPTGGLLGRVEDLPPLASRNVRAVVGRPGRPPVYVVPRGDGRVVVGATADERGFDTSVTAGGVHDLLRESYDLLPAIHDYELVETVAGLRPGTPDNAPLLGGTHLPGLVLATGHFRNGILLAPITAEVVASAVIDDEMPEVARAFAPDRFAARRTDDHVPAGAA